MANELKTLEVGNNTYYFKHFTNKMIVDILNEMAANWGKVKIPVPVELAERISESIDKKDIISCTTENGHTISIKKGMFDV